MKKEIIYHGSEKIIEQPSLKYSGRFNDYGVGFYCAESDELAKEWACKNNKDGFVNAYELNLEGLNLLNLEDGNHNALNWIALLLKNRIFKTDSPIAAKAREFIIKQYTPDTEGKDIIRGYRADDSYFRFAQAFIENTISLRSLNDALRLGKLGIQTVLMTQKAIDAVEFKGASRADKETYYARFVRRDIKAREDYRKIEMKRGLNLNELYIVDIIREEMDANDPRIQRSLRK